jgi:ABC-2 type transport system permease protein
MIATIKAEFRKLLTVRSTYIILGLAFALELLFAFWANGVKVNAAAVQLPTFLQSQFLDAVSALALIGAFAGILLVTHEYRYNTIMYTLTASNRRLKVLVAKVVVISVFAIVFTLVMGALSPLLAWIGASIGGHNLGPQTFSYLSVLEHSLFYGWAYSMAGVVLAFLIRSQIGSIAALLLLPGLVEQLLTLVLKNNAMYLPFSVLNSVIHDDPRLSAIKAAGIFMIYLVIGWLASAVTFAKRDAN